MHKGKQSQDRKGLQLCQYQAHAVNHQPTKCRTPDFYNRQNGTSWESGTFPIKKQQKQKTCFPALFSEGWANHELLSLSARCFFCYQNTLSRQPLAVMGGIPPIISGNFRLSRRILRYSRLLPNLVCITLKD